MARPGDVAGKGTFRSSRRQKLGRVDSEHYVPGIVFAVEVLDGQDVARPDVPKLLDRDEALLRDDRVVVTGGRGTARAEPPLEIVPAVAVAVPR